MKKKNMFYLLVVVFLLGLLNAGAEKIGYDTVGGSWQSCSYGITGSNFTMNETGIAYNMSTYFGGWGADGTVAMAVYYASNHTLVGNTTPWSGVEADAAWHTLTFPAPLRPTLYAGKMYYFVMTADDFACAYSGITSSGLYNYSTSGYWSIWPQILGWNVGDRKSSIYLEYQVQSETDTTPPSFNQLITAGNPNDEQFGSDTTNKYYRNGTWQTEDWIYIKVNITDDTDVSKVICEWKNETGWYNFTMTDNGDDTYYINLSSQPSYSNYTFNIHANDTSNNWMVRYNWTFYDYEAVWGTSEQWRKYVGLNATAEDFSYEQFYLWNSSYNSDQINDRALIFEQPTDGTIYDSIYWKYNKTTGKNEGWCISYVGAFIGSQIKMNTTEITNIYFHTWWRTNNHEDWLTMGYEKENNSQLDTNDDEYYQLYESNSKYNLTVPGQGFKYDDYYLEAKYFDIENRNFSDNDINLFMTKIFSATEQYPSIISAENFSSFIILNLPNNATLQSLDTDNDDVTDFNELFTYFTDPRDSDTDDDLISDNADCQPLNSSNSENCLTTCTCPSINLNWQIDLSENCNITTNCNLGTGHLNFTGTGNFYCGAVINTTNLDEPGNGGTIWIDGNCEFHIRTS